VKRFDEEIRGQLAAAACIVVIWSPESVESDWVKEEAEEGKSRGILLPVSLRRAKVPFGFRRLQTISLDAWAISGSRSDLAALDEAISEVLDDQKEASTPQHTIGDNPESIALRRVVSDEVFRVPFELEPIARSDYALPWMRPSRVQRDPPTAWAMFGQQIVRPTIEGLTTIIAFWATFALGYAVGQIFEVGLPLGVFTQVVAAIYYFRHQ